VEQEDRKTGRVFRDGSGVLVDAFVEVHRQLGPGLLESAYEECLCCELAERGLRFERQRAIAIGYKGVQVGTAYRADLIVEGRFLVEIKACERLTPVHVAQVLTYLKLARLPTGFLVNFNVVALRDGLRRLTRKPQ
jgi:GxxExxY protein